MILTGGDVVAGIETYMVERFEKCMIRENDKKSEM